MIDKIEIYSSFQYERKCVYAERVKTFDILNDTSSKDWRPLTDHTTYRPKRCANLCFLMFLPVDRKSVDLFVELAWARVAEKRVTEEINLKWHFDG